jgi:hypothetical protein
MRDAGCQRLRASSARNSCRTGLACPDPPKTTLPPIAGGSVFQWTVLDLNQ